MMEEVVEVSKIVYQADKVCKTIFFRNAFGTDSDPFSVFQTQIFAFQGHVAPRLCAT